MTIRVVFLILCQKCKGKSLFGFNFVSAFMRIRFWIMSQNFKVKLFKSVEKL